MEPLEAIAVTWPKMRLRGSRGDFKACLASGGSANVPPLKVGIGHGMTRQPRLQIDLVICIRHQPRESVLVQSFCGLRRIRVVMS